MPFTVKEGTVEVVAAIVRSDREAFKSVVERRTRRQSGKQVQKSSVYKHSQEGVEVIIKYQIVQLGSEECCAV